jgi:hypothetical protein
MVVGSGPGIDVKLKERKKESWHSKQKKRKKKTQFFFKNDIPSQSHSSLVHSFKTLH